MKLNSCIIFKVLLISLMSLSTNLIAQSSALSGKIFNSVDEPSIYKYYTSQFLVTFWVYKEDLTKVVDIDTVYYGFYDSCELPSLDSLKQSGTYYFEVDSSDFVDEETTKANIHNSCGELSTSSEGKDIFMNIYYSSRQQYATYRRVQTLPPNVLTYLKKKGIKIN